MSNKITSPVEATLYDSLSSYRRLERLIEDGETEGPYLECKSPQSPRMNPGLKAQLAEAVSGFSNSSGGIIIFGVSTTKHTHTGLDVMTQLEPIANCREFERQLQVLIPSLSTPSVQRFRTKHLKRRASDSRGIVILSIPQTDGDPVQSAHDDKFYFRTGDQFMPAPFELIKRLFVATATPDLYLGFDASLAKLDPDGCWSVPLALSNRSSAVARDTSLSIEFLTPEACQDIQCPAFIDACEVNPQRKLFWVHQDRPVHRGMVFLLGNIRVKMRKGKRDKRRLDVEFTLYASNMRARVVRFAVHLAKRGLKARVLKEHFLY